MAGSAGTGGVHNFYNRGPDGSLRFQTNLFGSDIAPGDIVFVDDNVLAMGRVKAGSSCTTPVFALEPSQISTGQLSCSRSGRRRPDGFS